ncbi:YjcZ family sporulation protein [Brevibacillus sp. WF146]|nr:YjcZ family sporulation protein [Brevibacillus sp. WF146]
MHSSRKGGKAMGLFRRREEFALVLVLFVLLTIVGCSCD